MKNSLSSHSQEITQREKEPTSPLLSSSSHRFLILKGNSLLFFKFREKKEKKRTGLGGGLGENGAIFLDDGRKGGKKRILKMLLSKIQKNHSALFCLSIPKAKNGRRKQNAPLSLLTLYSPAVGFSIVLMSSRKKSLSDVALILYGCSSSKVIYLCPNSFSMLFHTDQGIL